LSYSGIKADRLREEKPDESLAGLNQPEIMAHLCALFASGLDNGVKFLPRQSHNNQPTGKNDDDQKYHAGDKPGLHEDQDHVNSPT
jgi:hypothetical protein